MCTAPFKDSSGDPSRRSAISTFCVLFGMLLLAPDLAFGQRGPVRSLQEIRQEGVIIQKWDTSCGAAALATVLTYSLHDPVSEREVASGMLRMTEPLKIKYQGGFSLLDMKHFAELRGFKGVGYRKLTLDSLLRLNSPIVPIIQYGNPHFVVVRGLHSRSRLSIADPGFGNRTISVEDFVDVWQDGIGFVVTP
jgi:predicted double-glycine peptidase